MHAESRPAAEAETEPGRRARPLRLPPSPRPGLEVRGLRGSACGEGRAEGWWTVGPRGRAPALTGGWWKPGPAGRPESLVPGGSPSSPSRRASSEPGPRASWAVGRTGAEFGRRLCGEETPGSAGGGILAASQGGSGGH